MAGNVISVSRKIALNQSLNKPTISIAEPTAETNVDSSDELFVRGLANDEDGISAVKYSLDGGEYVTQETKGVFYAKVADGSSLTPGSHRITAIAIDSTALSGLLAPA